jgi:hypothetical protein
MEKRWFLGIVLALIIWAPTLKAQVSSKDTVIHNPRISTKQTLPTDSLGAHNKLVSPNPSAEYNPDEVVKGGVLSLSGLLGFPEGDFYQNTHNAIGYGIDFTMLFNLAGKRSKAEWENRWANMYAGGNFQWMRLNGASDQYSFADNNSTTEVSAKIKNNIMGIGLVTRVELFPGVVKLFAEAGLGARVFSGSHHLEITNTPYGTSNPEDIYSTTTNKNLQSSLIGNYSYGGGVRFGTKGIGLEFKVLSVKGSTANYVDINSIQFNRTNNTVSYQTHKSHTDVVVFSIGLSGRF